MQFTEFWKRYNEFHSNMDRVLCEWKKEIDGYKDSTSNPAPLLKAQERVRSSLQFHKFALKKEWHQYKHTPCNAECAREQQAFEDFFNLDVNKFFEKL